MRLHNRSSIQYVAFSGVLVVGLVVGCGQTAQPPAENAETGNSEPAVAAGETSPQSSAPADGMNGQLPQQADTGGTDREPAIPALPEITFGSGPSLGNPSMLTPKTGTAGELSGPDLIIAKLKDLQILLGTWRGITQKEYGGFKAVDETVWVWDFQTDPAQPALVMQSEASPYYQAGSLTYLPESNKYQLTLTDADEKSATYLGEFSEAIADEQGDDGKPQRTYKLELTEVNPTDNETLRLVFNQKNNNRYLLEIYRQRGANDRFFRIDTVSTQREGTSMALVDEGYGEKTCIISGGLGTISVSHQGRTFYVCCTGCKAAFEEDPQRWITRYEEQKKDGN